MAGLDEKTPLISDSVEVAISPSTSETEVKKGVREQSSFVSVFSVWNMMMGTSLLTVPWAIQQSGLLFSILIFVVMCALAVYTGIILLKGSSKLEVDPGTGLMPEFLVACRDVIGPWTTWMNFGGNFIVMSGALIVYWILIVDLSYNSINAIGDFIAKGEPLNSTEPLPANNSPFVSAHVINGVCGITEETVAATPLLAPWTKKYVFPLAFVPVFLPMLQLEKVTAFSRLSTMGTLSLFVLFAFVLTKCATWGLNVDFGDPTSPSYVPQYRSTFPTLSGVASMAFFVHNAITTIFKHNVNQTKIVRDLSLGFLLAFLSYTFVGLGIYLTFPGNKACIKQNFIDNIRSDDLFSLIVQVLYFLRMMTIFPIVCYVLRVQVFTVLYSQDYPGKLPTFIFSVLALIPCVLLAIFFPNVGDIIRYSGALCAFLLMFILPCVFFVQVKRRFKQTWRPYVVIGVIICVVGLVNFVTQFVV